MATTETPSFYDLVDELRELLFDADAERPGEIHSFMQTMRHRSTSLDQTFYLDAFEHLNMLGHIGVEANGMGFDANARLSAVGKDFVRQQREARGGPIIVVQTPEPGGARAGGNAPVEVVGPVDLSPDATTSAQRIKADLELILKWFHSDDTWMLHVLNAAGDLVDVGVALTADDALLGVADRLLPPAPGEA